MKLTDEIRSLFSDGKEWIELEIEYAKLTMAEKFTILLSTLVLGAVCLLMFMVVLILLSFALVDVFKLLMAPGLAYLSVAGVLIVLIVIVYLLRKPLLLNPIARLISKLIVGNPNI
ncbi:MAG: phage holin family protein [Muribaculaceae bacterium]|nr:phage holin family protein [Muribaculaceae bacterium]